jgi:hypothetical protein
MQNWLDFESGIDGSYGGSPLIADKRKIRRFPSGFGYIHPVRVDEALGPCFAARYQARACNVSGPPVVAYSYKEGPAELPLFKNIAPSAVDPLVRGERNPPHFCASLNAR